jgi:hypothetical protein
MPISGRFLLESFFEKEGGGTIGFVVVEIVLDNRTGTSLLEVSTKDKRDATAEAFGFSPLFEFPSCSRLSSIENFFNCFFG